MEKIVRFFNYVRGKYALLTSKKYSTLAGTFVYFLAMSVVPFSLWLTILFSRFELPVERVFELPVFRAVEPTFLKIREESARAGRGASAILICTALYSASGFFYHLRRGGEIVYGYTREKSGWKVRLSALGFSLLTMAACALFFAVFGGGAVLFSRLFSGIAARIVTYVYFCALSFFLVLMLNAYACPYKTDFVSVVKGTCLTVGAWAVSLVAFAAFLKLGNTRFLYGALGTAIVFLLWLYVSMLCFAAGMAINSDEFEKRRKKEEKTL